MWGTEHATGGRCSGGGRRSGACGTLVQAVCYLWAVCMNSEIIPVGLWPGQRVLAHSMVLSLGLQVQLLMKACTLLDWCILCPVILICIVAVKRVNCGARNTLNECAHCYQFSYCFRLVSHLFRTHTAWHTMAFIYLST
jgi:hypothetical protein